MIFKKIQSFWKWIWKDVKAGQPEKAVDKIKTEIKEELKENVGGIVMHDFK
jgi:hypothetical protein